jgi:hypothetical protein
MSGKRTLHDYFSSGKKQKISDDESPVQDELQQPSTSRTSTIPVECPVITEVKLKSDLLAWTQGGERLAATRDE